VLNMIFDAMNYF